MKSYEIDPKVAANYTPACELVETVEEVHVVKRNFFMRLLCCLPPKTKRTTKIVKTQTLEKLECVSVNLNRQSHVLFKYENGELTQKAKRSHGINIYPKTCAYDEKKIRSVTGLFASNKDFKTHVFGWNYPNGELYLFHENEWIHVSPVGDYVRTKIYKFVTDDTTYFIVTDSDYNTEILTKEEQTKRIKGKESRQETKSMTKKEIAEVERTWAMSGPAYHGVPGAYNS